MRKTFLEAKLVPVGLGFIVFIIDQLVKSYVTASMHLGQSIPVINDFFHITYVLNPGAAFGMFANQRVMFIVVAVVLCAVVLYYRKQLAKESMLMKYGVSMLLSGAVGNLYDRLQSGLVVDFFDFRVWPVFNIADIAICVGAALIVIDIFFGRKENDTDLQG
ncbi:Lipoprotein signal peptidase [Anaerovibrio sp. JC8]|uniref:signal peptidase II n=1 Tax=Anaerovibrio sp. JC8 TaxID=1240085 RepID=UPI000A0D7F23|nr:signal peptidase II [Anaerovibrio sp. JC8]ORU00695.1 Lipoprotein signal peptidase [Anaerovibrio sp. JC8]